MLREHRLALWAAAAAGAVALTGVAVPLQPSPAAASPAIDWRPCGDDGTAECATLRLPVDWSRPDGPTFGLAIARRKALDPSARVGTLVFGPGGPGDSGVQRVTDGIDRFSDRLRRHFDIVSFDPRGVGASNPVTCSAALVASAPSPMIKSAAGFRATLDHNARLRADCRERTGPLYDHADTLSTVRDVDAIRTALGEPKLTFHGSSYGTLLGEMYAETFPKRVRAMVLESVNDHSVPDAGRFLTSEMAAAQDSFDQFVAWCGRTKDCALHGKDSRAIWRDLRARAARGELPDPSDPSTPLPEFALVLMAYKSFYGPDWSDLAKNLAALNTSQPVKPALAGKPTAEETTKDPFTAQFCSDWSLPVRDYTEYAQLMRQTERVAPDMTFARPVVAISACLGWPQPVRNPQHRLDVRGSAPILLANALHDPATPYAWARNVARQLGRTGRLLTYEGAGHGSYNRGPCMQNTIDTYLIYKTLPPPTKTCPST
ncbi:alpha/beta hydrolase [Actinomadura madurae]|uniref:alpha/beta hydrolase n=1 Tax=Actinomadura madurae TaxID=1993 RepID=UPI002025F9BA|nr:alpha/beta hydrolase [Actinomadura madurae]URM96916.1 alpha/beta hydrolase [Actinomadura madurae]